jgi:hypothetical protein
MDKIVVVDSGRAFVKSLSSKGPKVFQSALAETDGKFKLTVRTNPDDLWIRYQNNEYLVGDLAVRQKPGSAVQDRDSNKTNQQNFIQVITACSLHVELGQNIILLTNCPARDWSDQEETVENLFPGYYIIDHKAGDINGRKIAFKIKECHVLPEAEAAYFGFCYNTDLKLTRPDVFNAKTLILDIGDQTCNYVSMNPGGEPYDEGSGSLDLGMFTAYADLQKWLMTQGVEITQAELIRSIIYGEPITNGSQIIKYTDKLHDSYAKVEREIYNQLSALLKMSRYQYLLLCGGSAKPLNQLFVNRYPKLEVLLDPGAQMLNCYGFYILYMLSL